MFTSTRLQQIGTAVNARCRVALGYPARMGTNDRALLEQDILPALARNPRIHSILFVGCDWYTAHYERLLAGTTVHTLDPDPRRSRYGAARHRVAELQELDSLFGPASFDAIVCNGVYGWGLDTFDDCVRAFTASARCLRPGGWFVLGWNNVPAHDPLTIAALEWDGLESEPFEHLGVAKLEVPGSVDRHTFAFYRRIASGLAFNPASPGGR